MYFSDKQWNILIKTKGPIGVCSVELFDFCNRSIEKKQIILSISKVNTKNLKLKLVRNYS